LAARRALTITRRAAREIREASNVHYHLYYRLKSPQTVQVLALWHTSRHPDSGL
jgi:plasmid stabilization system protein ParE